MLGAQASHVLCPLPMHPSPEMDERKVWFLVSIQSLVSVETAGEQASYAKYGEGFCSRFSCPTVRSAAHSAWAATHHGGLDGLSDNMMFWPRELVLPEG